MTFMNVWVPPQVLSQVATRRWVPLSNVTSITEALPVGIEPNVVYVPSEFRP